MVKCMLAGCKKSMCGSIMVSFDCFRHGLTVHAQVPKSVILHTFMYAIVSRCVCKDFASRPPSINPLNLRLFIYPPFFPRQGEHAHTARLHSGTCVYDTLNSTRACAPFNQVHTQRQLKLLVRHPDMHEKQGATAEGGGRAIDHPFDETAVLSGSGRWRRGVYVLLF